MTRTRAIFSALVLAAGFAAMAPAQAQIMPNQGIDIPWLYSAQERAERDACRRALPECRASVRDRMELERAIVVTFPWAGLGLAILAGLFWLRAKEKKRERKKQLARMHHTPGAFKKLDKEKQAKTGDEEEEEFDRMNS